MAPISRVRTALTGFPGAPGVITMYCLTPSTFVPALRAFWNSFAGAWPSSVFLQVENSGDVLDATSGELTGGWTTAAVASVQGGSSGPYAAPTGAVVNWHTDSVIDGKRLRGKSYIVPLSAANYQNDGSLETVFIGAMEIFCADFVAAVASNFIVWHRHRDAAPATATRPAVTERAGGYSIVTRSSVPDRSVVLRSRRD